MTARLRADFLSAVGQWDNIFKVVVDSCFRYFLKMKGIYQLQTLPERITKGRTSARRKEKPKGKMQLKSEKK